MKLFGTRSFLSSLVMLIGLGLFSFPVAGQNLTVKLDDFNRSNNVVLGLPSGGGTANWLETETAGSNDYRARIENNMLVLGSFNNAGVGSSGLEQVSWDASGRYATIFNQAASELTWAFNFRQTRSGTSGFGATTYGVAYILGSSKATYTDTDASGYAVIIGNANSPDPVKLVRFKNGLTANSNITTLISSSEITETAFYSVKVNFEPCTKTWTLQVRNDNGTFADPLTVANTAQTVADQTYTSLNLNYTGTAYNHGTVNVSAYFDNIYVPAATALATINYTWIGSVSSDFSDPANWSPVRSCVRAIDHLEFKNGGIVSVTNVATQEIGRISVSNNTVLNLKATAGATQTLSIAGGPGADLLVEAGSQLVVDSNDPLEISLKTGATGSVSGTITFQNTAANLGRAHRLLASDMYAIVFENGSQFIAKNLTGEPFGNSGTANIITFKANSTYFSKDGASPFGLATPNSKVVFETGSLYKHEQTGTAPKFDGRIYADFELNVANTLAIIFGTSAATTTRIDNFTISSGTMNITLASGSTALPMHIRGNLTVASGAALNFNPAAAANTSLLTFNGTQQQQLSGNINLGVFANLEVNNPAGLLLRSPLTINGNLNLVQGIIAADPSISLYFADNATATSASNLSYVSGRVFKTGDDAFTFPVGKNGFYAPVAISAPLTVTDQFRAEYFRQNPGSLFGSTLADSLVQLSETEYWDLERVSGTSEVKVKLSYDAARSSYVADPKDLRIAHFKSSNTWVNEGLTNEVITPAYALYSTRTTQNSFSPFTFGAVSSNNPLPVSLTKFTASQEKNVIVLSWETASELNNDRFEIGYSANGKDFVKIGEVKGQGSSNTTKRYAFTHKNPQAGVNYYRLKQIDSDGKYEYSQIISANCKGAEKLITFYPNPARNFIQVSLPDKEAPVKVEIVNSIGKTVKTETSEQIISELRINLSELPAGTYFLRTDAYAQPLRFIKIN